MTQHTDNFGLLRLILALLVVLGHFRILPGATPEGIFTYADFAVDAFFIISGYLVYASFDKTPVIGSFYIRRLFRIYPLYFVIVCIQGVGMALIAGGITAHASELAHYFAVNLIMANFLAYDLGDLLRNFHNPGINPSLWTLKIEVAFYFLLPLLWYCTRRFGTRFLIFIYIASTLYTVLALHYGDEIIARQLPGKLRFFVIGFALYHYRDSFRFSLPVNVGVLLAASALCAFRAQMWLLPVYPLLLGIVVSICALRLPVVPLSSDISYGVYLFHGPLIQFALLLGIFQATPAFLALLLITVCALAYLAEHAIERPGINLGHRLSSLWTKHHG